MNNTSPLAQQFVLATTAFFAGLTGIGIAQLASGPGIACHLHAPADTLFPLAIAVLVALRFCSGATTSWMRYYTSPDSGPKRQIGSLLFLISYGLMLVMAGNAATWSAFLEWLGWLSLLATVAAILRLKWPYPGGEKRTSFAWGITNGVCAWIFLSVGSDESLAGSLAFSLLALAVTVWAFVVDLRYQLNMARDSNIPPPTRETI